MHRLPACGHGEQPPRRALVLGDDIGIFLAVARSLGRQGIEVHVAPSDLAAPGLASAYVDAVHILPPYHEDAAVWLAALRRLIAEHDYQLILPCSDAGLAILDRHAESIARPRLALPNPAALVAFTDKAKTRALAASLGVPIAAGGLIGPADTAAALAERHGFPFVLKPRASYRLGDRQTKRSARIVHDFAALEQALAAGRDGLLAEAFFRGEGVGVSVLARDGAILLAWQHRRLRAASETGASTVRVGERPDARLLADVEALALATKLDGVAMFEFRVDRASGTHILLEVNARFWGSLPLALAGGADFPAALWAMLAGEGSEPRPCAEEAITRRSMTGEYDRLSCAIESPRSASARLASLAAMLHLFATLPFGRRFDSWAADDRAPFVAERRQLVRRLMRAVTARLAAR